MRARPRPSPFLVAAALALFAIAISSQAAPAPTATPGPTATPDVTAIVLEGYLGVYRYYGPPGFGKSPHEDRIDEVYCLRLLEPRSFDVDGAAIAIGFVQVAGIARGSGDESLRPLVGKKAALRGRLARATSDDHHTFLVLVLGESGGGSKGATK